ncbi:MAG: DUF2589 domain-containing protein [Actinomycetota bacterium]
MAGEKDAATSAQPIEALVGSILSSVVKAQGLAGSQLVDMIEQVGFEPALDDEDATRRPRMFEFDFFRNEVDEDTQEVVRNRVTARVPLITLINLPTIAIDEATIDMDLRIVSHSETGDGIDGAPLQLRAVPAQKRLVRTSSEALTVDAAGTVRMRVTMRQRDPIGLDRIESLLDGAVDEEVGPLPTPPPTPSPESLDPAGGALPPPTPTSETMSLPEDLGAAGTAVARPVPATKKRAAKKRAAKKAAAKRTAAKKKAAARKRGTKKRAAKKRSGG